MRVPKYHESGSWPYIMNEKGTTELAADFYGDVQCPFCGETVAYEGSILKLKTKCKGCNSEVVEFEEETVANKGVPT